MTWLPGSRCRRIVSFRAVLLSLVLLGPCGPGTQLRAQETASDGFLTEASGDSVRQRARLLAEMGVDRWHRQGYRGRGVTVAVLDTGFRGYRGHLGKSLPASVTVHSFRRDGNLEARDSQHGILCAEVIHALAPDAKLLLANWQADKPEQFLQAARWARRQGAQIISCSLIMPSWGDGEGGGPVNDALTRIVGSGSGRGDLLCFASAGNIAQRHWAGRFRAGARGFHQWQPDQSDNGVTPWGSDPVSMELCWQPGANYELTVIDDSDRVVGRSSGRLGAKGKVRRGCAVVRFTPHDGQSYRVRVRLVGGRAGAFHLVALGGWLADATARGSIPCPADGPAVIAVGAVDSAGQRVAYSSCGPNSRRPKPDFVAVVPFPSRWRDRPFTGTSAAAPQAAALAALWWSRHPGWKADKVRAALRASAKDLGPPGHDFETGYGLIRLP